LILLPGDTDYRAAIDRCLDRHQLAHVLAELSSLDPPVMPSKRVTQGQFARAPACSRSATAAAINLSAAVHSASRHITTPSAGTGAWMLAAMIASVGLKEPYRDSGECARVDVALAADRGRVAQLLGHTLDRARD
jgi:hypothetical protein